MDPPPVSVAVTNYNGEAYLDECLHAIQAQTLPPAEVLVVDDASSDGSLELLRTRHPSVRVERLPENRGPAAARNLALSKASHRYLLSVDNDAVLEAECLEKLLAAMLARPDAALVAPRTVYYRERNRIHYDGGFMNYLGLVSLRNLGVELGQADQGIQEVDASMAVTLLIDREKIGADDLYDEGYFFYFEDIDWSYRLRLEGHALLVHGGALVFHKEGTDELSFRKDRSYPSKRAYWFTRNRWRLALKCLRLRSLLLGAPAALAYEAAFVAFLTARGHLWSYLKGSASVLSTLGEILRLRKAVQSRRTLADRQLLGGRRLTFVSAGGSGLLAGLGERLLNAWILLWWRIIRPLI